MPAGCCGVTPRCVVGFVTVCGVVAVGVPPVALGLGAFGLGVVGVGVPNFLAFNDLLLVSAIIFHRRILLLRLFLVLVIKSLFP
mgnify:CR=1 FL=1